VSAPSLFQLASVAITPGEIVLGPDHLEPASMSFVRDGDLRYVDQGYELKIAFPAGAIGKTHSLRISGPASTRLTNANRAITSPGHFGEESS